MLMKPLFPIGIITFFSAGIWAQTAAVSPIPPDSEIRRILVERIDNYRMGVGIVVGVIDAQGRRVIVYGSLDKGDTRPLNGDTIF